MPAPGHSRSAAAAMIGREGRPARLECAQDWMVDLVKRRMGGESAELVDAVARDGLSHRDLEVFGVALLERLEQMVIAATLDPKDGVANSIKTLEFLRKVKKDQGRDGARVPGNVTLVMAKTVVLDGRTVDLEGGDFEGDQLPVGG